MFADIHTFTSLAQGGSTPVPIYFGNYVAQFVFSNGMCQFDQILEGYEQLECSNSYS